MSEPFVQPIRIPSPYTGALCAPRLRITEDRSYKITEAIWICPTTGEFFKRGIVSREPKNPTSDANASS